MTERRTECDKHAKRTEALEKAMFIGNGKPAVVVDIATIKVTNKIILGLQLATITAIVKLLFGA